VLNVSLFCRSITTAIGFGIGVGANVLTRFAVRIENVFVFKDMCHSSFLYVSIVEIFIENLWTYSDQWRCTRTWLV